MTMPSPATPAPTGSTSGARLDAWRAGVEALGSALVELDADPTLALLGTGTLTGDTAAAWSAVRTALDAAWGTYRAARELADGIGASRDDRAAAVLGAATFPTAASPVPAETAVRSAADAMATARAFVASITVAWDDWTGRVQVARDQVVAANPAAPEVASADALLDLLLRDPFAVHEADLNGIEAAARAAAERLAGHQRAVGRLQLDLDQARTACATLRDQHPRAVAATTQAAERISGFAGASTPVGDTAQLEEWLDRITSAATRDAEGAARTLRDWQAAAQARIDELSAVEQAAAAALARRDALRGRWQAYKSKAGDLSLDERPAVTAALASLQERLWTAPCDLAAAERQLVELAHLLDRRGPGAGEG